MKSSSDTIQQFIEEVRERSEKATGGEWSWRDFGSGNLLMSSAKGKPCVLAFVLDENPGICTINNQGLLEQITPEHPNAIMLASARTDLPKAIEALSYLMGSFEQVRAAEYSTGTTKIYLGQLIEHVAKIITGETK